MTAPAAPAGMLRTAVPAGPGTTTVPEAAPVVAVTPAEAAAGVSAGARPPRPRLADDVRALSAAVRRALTPAGAVTAVLFAVLFAHPAYLLVRDWWDNPEAGHGLLLAPLALWIAWRAGVGAGARPNRRLGAAVIFAAVAFRWVSDLAAELFVMRGSMVLALAGLVVWHFGWRQVLRWWLPFALFALSVPFPELILSRVALPMQMIASKIGAALLAWREIPVQLNGNVIRIPGRELFVAEACSGLRSLTALISLGVLLGAIALRHPASRVVLLASVLPVAILLNGVRVFLTGFLVVFVDPALGEGFMHKTEGMMVFGVAFAILAGVAWLIGRGEHRLLAPGRHPPLQLF